MIIWHDVTQGTTQWRLMRIGLWTGSIAIKLLQGKQFPRTYDWDGNDATRRGHALEEVAMMEYRRKYGHKPQRPGFVTNSVYPNAGYSPDGVDGGWLLECKAFSGARYEALINGDIPLEIMCQMLFGMIITGKRKARLLLINPDHENQFVVIEVGYDKLIGHNIRAKLKADLKKRLAAGCVPDEFGLIRTIV